MSCNISSGSMRLCSQTTACSLHISSTPTDTLSAQRRAHLLQSHLHSRKHSHTHTLISSSPNTDHRQEVHHYNTSELSSSSLSHHHNSSSQTCFFTLVQQILSHFYFLFSYSNYYQNHSYWVPDHSMDKLWQTASHWSTEAAETNWWK